MAPIPSTDLDVTPLCLGGNVFGWTAGPDDAFAVLDAYAAAGGTLVDSADAYMGGRLGTDGGESETLLGEWLAARGRPEGLAIATKVGKKPDRPGLSARNVRQAAEGSLRRLGVEALDLYYAHADDPDVPLAETLGAFDALVHDGLVRYVGLSNYSADRLTEALDVCAREGLARPVVLQQHYNLVEREEYEGPLRDAVVRAGIGTLPYYGLASGFLTGRYRPGSPPPEGPRSRRAGAYLGTDRGPRVLAAVDEVARAHAAPYAAVALGWLAAQPTVVAPIASARSPEQLRDLLAVASLELTPDDLALLDSASRPPAPQ